MTLTSVKWQTTDYHRMIAAGLFVDRSVELLEGLIVEMTPEGPLHANQNCTTAEQFRDLLGKQVMVRENKPITIDNTNEPEPDIALIRRGDYRQTHPIPNDVYLIVEFSKSTLKKDMENKRKIYARSGIIEYWVVNLIDHILWVYREPVQGDYRSQQSLTSGTISLLQFPNCSITVKSIFGG